MQRQRTFLEVAGILLCIIVVGLLYNHFANSGIPLLAFSRQQKYFGDSVDNYRILPPVMVNIVAVILPWVEFLCGTFLILGIFIRGSSLLLSAMLFIFIVALSVSLIRGLDIECGCFLPWAESSKVGLRKLIEDIVMLAMGLQVFFFARPFVGLERLLKKS